MSCCRARCAARSTRSRTVTANSGDRRGDRDQRDRGPHGFFGTARTCSFNRGGRMGQHRPQRQHGRAQSDLDPVRAHPHPDGDLRDLVYRHQHRRSRLYPGRSAAGSRGRATAPASRCKTQRTTRPCFRNSASSRMSRRRGRSRRAFWSATGLRTTRVSISTARPARRGSSAGTSSISSGSTRTGWACSSATSAERVCRRR